MDILTKPLTAAQIRSANITEKSVLSKDFIWTDNTDCYFLCINGKRAFCFTCESNVTKSINKIKNKGLGFGWNKHQNTDEENGLIQASKNGENPFAYTIICGNPKYNKTQK